MVTGEPEPPNPEPKMRIRLLFVPLVGAVALSCSDAPTSMTGPLPEASLSTSLDASTLTAGWTCGTGPLTEIVGTEGNSFLSFMGETEHITRTFVNPYSGFEVTVEAEFNLNTASYDGLSGTNILLETALNDMLCLETDDGLRTLWNIGGILAGAGDDVVILSHPDIALPGTTFIDAGSGDDIIWSNHGAAGTTSLRGFAGNDLIHGAPISGREIIDGGLGKDFLISGGANETVLIFTPEVLWGSGDFIVHEGTPEVPGTGETFSLESRRSSMDVYMGADGFDVIQMSNGSDVLMLWNDEVGHHPLASPLRVIDVDEIHTGNGDNIVFLAHPEISYGDVTVRAGNGDDIIVTSDGDDVIHLAGGDNYVWTGGGANVVHAGPGNDIIHVADGVGNDEVYCDPDGNATVYADVGDFVEETCATVILFGQPPVADPGGPYTGVEGSPVTFDGTDSFDPDGGELSYEWDFGDGSAVATGPTPTHTYLDNGIYTVTLTVTDELEASHQSTTTATIENAPPVVGEIEDLPADPIQVNSAVTLSADFTDPGILDTHTAQIDWGDGTTSAGTVAQGSGSGTVTGGHTYGAAGVYTVTVTVTDNDGDSGSRSHEYVVVYDPDGGFVTGGGWIHSPEGALVTDPSASGRANFGFVSRYQRGSTVPTGNTQFQFRGGNLNFQSTSYDWLVISGEHRAQYRGEGRLQHDPNEYAFALTVIDGSKPGGGGENKLRFQLWDKVTGDLVYDNQSGSADDADPTTVLGGGNISVHTK